MNHAAKRMSAPAQRWQAGGLCLLLAAITFAVFGQTLRHEFITFDDNVYVYENAKVAGGLSLEGIAWVFTHLDCDLCHPLTMLSLMADCQFYGLHAGGYHFTNVLLHTASAIMLFLVLRQMTGALWRAAFVAAVFAIHPLRVESVAWVAERKDVLSGFFFMMTLGAYVRYVRKPNSLGRYLTVAFAFLLALLSKPTVVTLPFVLLLLDYWPLQRRESARRLILEKVPLLALAIGTCAITVLAAEKMVVNHAHVPMPARLGNAVISYVVYLRQMVWPEGLAVLYPFPHHGTPGGEVALAGALLAGLSAVTWRERRTRPWLLMGWLWYLGMLTPMIGIVQVGSFAHADRYAYLSQIGLYVALTWLVAEWRVSRLMLGGLMAGVLAALMVCAWIQTAYWQNNETLWPHTIACTTDNDFAHNELGIALQKNGKADEAITQYKEALRINPGFAQAHNNLGITLRQTGRTDEAITQYQLALEIMPDDAEAHFNLARVLFEKGRVRESIAQFQSALQLKPADMEVLDTLAWLLATSPQASLRDGKKAVQLARQANDLAGGKSPVVLRALAAALAESGQFDVAAQTAQKAIDLAQATGRQDLAGKLNGELRRYRAGLPLHQ
jgi:tetratricopeptide (TPR) repeat protein